MAQSVSLHILIPVKAFNRAKARLAPALDADERANLSRTMATGVVRAADTLATWVVCDDPAVAEWASSVGASVAWQPGLGLNGALQAATAERFEQGAERVAIVHADLPRIRSITWLSDETTGVVVVPDRHDDGTNVLSVPTPDFRFHYGPGSFRRHLGEAARLGLVTRVIHDSMLGWDIDVPDDLTVLDAVADAALPLGKSQD